MGKRIFEMTTEERREAGRKGGLKSGEARRKKKKMCETLETILGMTLKKGELNDIEEIQSLAELNGQNIDVQTAVLLAQVKKAMKGSVMSAEFIRDTVGQRPEDIVKLNADKEDTTLSIKVSYGDTEKNSTSGEDNDSTEQQQ